jgi:hypothetical protein
MHSVATEIVQEAPVLLQDGDLPSSVRASWGQRQDRPGAPGPQHAQRMTALTVLPFRMSSAQQPARLAVHAVAERRRKPNSVGHPGPRSARASDRRDALARPSGSGCLAVTPGGRRSMRPDVSFLVARVGGLASLVRGLQPGGRGGDLGGPGPSPGDPQSAAAAENAARCADRPQLEPPGVPGGGFAGEGGHRGRPLRGRSHFVFWLLPLLSCHLFRSGRGVDPDCRSLGRRNLADARPIWLSIGVAGLGGPPE